MIDDELVWHIDSHVLPAAFALLPGEWASERARAQLLATGLQETKFRARVQAGGGPAHGFWQFEPGSKAALALLLGHRTIGPVLRRVCKVLVVPATREACYEAIVHNDTLAACFARALLWNDPRSLPGPNDPAKGW